MCTQPQADPALSRAAEVRKAPRGVHGKPVSESRCRPPGFGNKAMPSAGENSVPFEKQLRMSCWARETRARGHASGPTQGEPDPVTPDAGRRGDAEITRHGRQWTPERGRRTGRAGRSRDRRGRTAAEQVTPGERPPRRGTQPPRREGGLGRPRRRPPARGRSSASSPRGVLRPPSVCTAAPRLPLSPFPQPWTPREPPDKLRLGACLRGTGLQPPFPEREDLGP